MARGNKQNVFDVFKLSSDGDGLPSGVHAIPQSIGRKKYMDGNKIGKQVSNSKNFKQVWVKIPGRTQNLFTLMNTS